MNIGLWIAYCAFHLGDYKKALEIYQNLQSQNSKLKNVLVNIACSYFYLGKYDNITMYKVMNIENRINNAVLLFTVNGRCFFNFYLKPPHIIVISR